MQLKAHDDEPRKDYDTAPWTGASVRCYLPPHFIGQTQCLHQLRPPRPRLGGQALDGPWLHEGTSLQWASLVLGNPALYLYSFLQQNILINTCFTKR